MNSLLVGSAAWTGGEEYGGEYPERINQLIDKVNQKALLAYASALRENLAMRHISRIFGGELQSRAQDPVR